MSWSQRWRSSLRSWAAPKSSNPSSPIWSSTSTTSNPKSGAFPAWSWGKSSNTLSPRTSWAASSRPSRTSPKTPTSTFEVPPFLFRLPGQVPAELLPSHRKEEYLRAHPSQVLATSERWVNPSPAHHLREHWGDIFGPGSGDSRSDHHPGHQWARFQHQLESQGVLDRCLLLPREGVGAGIHEREDGEAGDGLHPRPCALSPERRDEVTPEDSSLVWSPVVWEDDDAEDHANFEGEQLRAKRGLPEQHWDAGSQPECRVLGEEYHSAHPVHFRQRPGRKRSNDGLQGLESAIWPKPQGKIANKKSRQGPLRWRLPRCQGVSAKDEQTALMITISAFTSYQ